MEISLIAISAIVVGLTEIVKKFTQNTKVILLGTLLLAIACVFLAQPLLEIPDWRTTLFTGIIVGLQAMGLYSGGKAIKESGNDN